MRKLYILIVITLLLTGCVNNEQYNMRIGELKVNTLEQTYIYKTTKDQHVEGDIEVKFENESPTIHLKTISELVDIKNKLISDDMFISIEDIRKQGYFVSWENDTIYVRNRITEDEYALPYEIIDDIDVPTEPRTYTSKFIDYNTVIQLTADDDVESLSIDSIYADTKQGTIIKVTEKLKQNPDETKATLTIEIPREIRVKLKVLTTDGEEYFRYILD